MLIRLLFIMFLISFPYKAHAMIFDFTGDYIDAFSINNPPVFDIHHDSDKTNLFERVVNHHPDGQSNLSAYLQFKLDTDVYMESFEVSGVILPGPSRVPRSIGFGFSIYTESLSSLYPGPNNQLFEPFNYRVDDDYQQILPLAEREINVGLQLSKGYYWLAIEGGSSKPEYQDLQAELYFNDIKEYKGRIISTVPEPDPALLFIFGLIAAFLIHGLLRFNLKNLS